MTRRSLEDGLTGTLDEQTRSFVRGEKPAAETTEAKSETNQVLPQMVGRKSLTIKLHPQVASDLKRLSLERQLNGLDPHTMQDMAEEAITAWLKKQT